MRTAIIPERLLRMSLAQASGMASSRPPCLPLSTLHRTNFFPSPQIYLSLPLPVIPRMTRQSRSFCFSIKHLLRCVKVARALRCCCEGPSGLFVRRTLRCSLTLGGEHVLWRVNDLTSNVLVCSDSKRRRGFALRLKRGLFKFFNISIPIFWTAFG
jgi:hypothetical protein